MTDSRQEQSGKHALRRYSPRFTNRVLLDADPRANIANVQRRVGVMLRGRWFVETQLQAWLKAIATGYSR